MADVTDREALDLRCKSTIEYEFGSICDDIKRGVESEKIDPQFGEALLRMVRRHGNDAIRVIGNHLEYYAISRNHRKDTINPGRVAKRIADEGKSTSG